jgi:hypothetical protein
VIAYRATVDVPRELVLYLGRLLAQQRQARGTRRGTPALTCCYQTLLVLIWLLKAEDLTLLGAGSASPGRPPTATATKALACSPPRRSTCTPLCAGPPRMADRTSSSTASCSTATGSPRPPCRSRAKRSTPGIPESIGTSPSVAAVSRPFEPRAAGRDPTGPAATARATQLTAAQPAIDFDRIRAYHHHGCLQSTKHGPPARRRNREGRCANTIVDSMSSHTTPTAPSRWHPRQGTSRYTSFRSSLSLSFNIPPDEREEQPHISVVLRPIRTEAEFLQAAAGLGSAATGPVTTGILGGVQSFIG